MRPIRDFLRRLFGARGGFHEDWYSNEQAKMLPELVSKASTLRGLNIEIGCWEGKSTTTIANACYPEVLECVDTWQGSYGENPEHISVQIARERNVLEIFRSNMELLTKGNYRIHQEDCFRYLEKLNARVKFCHVDASHDYRSVKRTLDLLLPKMVSGGILCGDDFVSAHMGRRDLEGGVERAVREGLPGFQAVKNLWWYRSP